MKEISYMSKAEIKTAAQTELSNAIAASAVELVVMFPLATTTWQKTLGNAATQLELAAERLRRKAMSLSHGETVTFQSYSDCHLDYLRLLHTALEDYQKNRPNR